jgi:hypothetical protein
MFRAECPMSRLMTAMKSVIDGLLHFPPAIGRAVGPELYVVPFLGLIDPSWCKRAFGAERPSTTTAKRQARHALPIRTRGPNLCAAAALSS